METKRKPIRATEPEIGKMPPQAIDMEEAVLGAILLEKQALMEVLDILQPESFYKEQNGRVYQAMVKLSVRRSPIDILSVVQELKSMGELEIVGGAYYVSALTDRIASSANIQYHARVVQQAFFLREMIRMCTSTIQKAYEPSADCFDVMAKATKEIHNLENGIVVNKIETIGDIAQEVINDSIVAMNSDEPIGLLTPLESLNVHTGGWRKSTLNIIAARPGMGKTAFALACALEPAIKGKPTAFFSLEMNKLELVRRALASDSGLNVQKVNNNQIKDKDLDRLNESAKAFKNYPLYIDDTPRMTIVELRAKARRLKENQKIELIVLDYLQLMTGSPDKRGNREQEVSEISRELKLLSRELDIPIIALCQLSRQTENRPGGSKKPQLSDLRESGAIEQDADNVFFLFRPEYYGIEFYSMDGVDYPAKELFIIIIAKFRNGALTEIRARWIGWLTKIVNFVEDSLKTASESTNELPY
jgi:replicative DNA helicase